MERAKRAGGEIGSLDGGKTENGKMSSLSKSIRRWRNCPKCYSSSKCNYWFLCLCCIPMNFVKMLSISNEFIVVLPCLVVSLFRKITSSSV